MTNQPSAHLRVRIVEFWNRMTNLMYQPGSAGGPWWRRAGVRIMRLGRGVFADLSEGQLTLWAMSLVYTTLLSLVPLLAISFSVLKGFGVHNQIEPFLLNMLQPLGPEKSQEITSQVIGFVDNTRVGVLGFVGFGVLFYTVIILMQKIERAFNYVWHTTEERNWLQRVRDYLSVIIIGPTLIFASLGAIASVLSTEMVESVSTIEPLGWLLESFRRLVPTLLVVAAFTFIYSFIPNTPVRIKSAFVGALIAGILWNAMGWFFAAFIASSSTYMTIYAGFATPIVFMVWLYLSWLVLFLGASISFYDQHPEYALKGRQAIRISIRMKERLSLLVAGAVGRSFYRGDKPMSTGNLAQTLETPVPAIEEVVGVLEKCGFLRRTDGDPPSFLPARPWESVRVADLLTAVRAYSGWQRLPSAQVIAEPSTDRLYEGAEQAMMEALGGTTLKDIALSGAPKADTALRPVAEPRGAPAE
ncbi:MAG: YhjD/YihY/BrkB family envelope integrity protein [Alphaproteobacteria bacterium]